VERIKVLVVEDDLEKRSTILDTLSNVDYISVVGELGSAEETLEEVESANPNVILIGSYLPADGYMLEEKISAEYPWISIIMIEDELREEIMRKAIFAGAKDVLIYPFTPSKLVDSIYRSYETERKKQLLQRDKTPEIREKSHQGQVITVFSTKGGVGKTFIATNLAVSLAQNKDKKVVLVDLDLDFGNAALSLNIIPRYTISDVINDIQNLDQDLMKGYLISHKSGIKLLAANDQPQMTDFINAEYIELIIKVLQSSFDYVIIDMPTRFYDPIVPAFQEADLLMLVITPEVAAIKNIKACMVSLNNLKYPRQKIRLLLNKVERRGDVKSKDVEKTLDQNLAGSLPAEHKPVSSSLNKGVPVVLLYPRAKVSRSLQKIVRSVLEKDSEQRDKTDSNHDVS